MLYEIAGLFVEMTAKYSKLQSRLKPYLSKNQAHSADITLGFSEEYLSEARDDNPHLTMEDCEYIWIGAQFYSDLIDFNGFVLHGSAVFVDDEVYIFSAPSGVGKSTHTKLWLKHFGSKARILNDDKPAIRIIGNEVFAYGTPFSGKHDISVNKKLPLKAIAAIERGEKNQISKMSKNWAMFCVLNQTIRPSEEERMEKLLSLIKQTLDTVPTFRLCATISEQAVITAYEAMKG